MKKSLKTESSWRKIITTFEKSNLGKAKFCKIQNISRPQFYYWCNKLRPDLKSEVHSIRSKKQESGFLPIKTTKNAETLSIKINNSLEIKFESFPDPAWIAKLINSVGELNDQY